MHLVVIPFLPRVLPRKAAGSVSRPGRGK
jgi:hypothetical protein